MPLLNTSRGFRSLRCPVCSLPTQWCFCTQTTLTPCATRLILLRHPNEKFRSSGTGFLLGQCLENVQIIEPLDCETLRKSLGETPVALLFPPDGEESGVVPVEMPGLQALIIPDGSWSEARRMVRKDPWLRSLPRVSPKRVECWLDNPLRRDKWERPCTAEAVGLWLAGEGQYDASQALRLMLDRFVAAHWRARGRIEATNEAPLSADS